MHKELISKEKAELAIQILICFIVGIYPLMLFELDLGSFGLQHLILFLSIMGVLLYTFLLIRAKEWKLKPIQNRIDITILALVIYAIVKIIIKIIHMTEENMERFNFEIMILALAALYLLIITKPMFREMYFDILLFSGLIVFALLLVRYLCGEGVNSALAIMIQDKAGIASYTILICMVGLWQYLRCQDKLRSVFYIGVLVTGFLVMFINQNRVSIWLMTMVFIALPVLQRPTAELVKRDMQICFIYLFLLSNMSLVTNYTSLLRVDVKYDLEQSVYLELLAAAGGMLFFKFWDRIPQGMDQKRLVMRKMRRAYQFILRLMCVIFIGILLGGERWKELPDGIGMNAAKGFAVPLAEEVRQGKGGFYICFEQLGIAGALLLLILCIFLISKLQRGFGFDKPVTSMLNLISGIFLIQILFWQTGENTLPLYWIFMVFAISYKEEREKVISKKLNLSHLKEEIMK